VRWEVVAQGTYAELLREAPRIAGELDRGRGDIRFRYFPPWMIRPAEWALDNLGRTLRPLGVEVTDAKVVGNTLRVYFRGSPVAWALVVAAILAALALGAFLIIFITFVKWVEKVFPWIVVVVGGLTAVPVLASALRRKR